MCLLGSYTCSFVDNEIAAVFSDGITVGARFGSPSIGSSLTKSANKWRNLVTFVAHVDIEMYSSLAELSKTWC